MKLEFAAGIGEQQILPFLCHEPLTGKLPAESDEAERVIVGARVQV